MQPLNLPERIFGAKVMKLFYSDESTTNGRWCIPIPQPDRRSDRHTDTENARPETIEATKPRFGKGDVPFDVEKVMKKSHEWREFEADWGIE